jgi:hypothetical protein
MSYAAHTHFHINGQAMQNLLLPNVPKYKGKFLPNTSTEKLGEGDAVQV